MVARLSIDIDRLRTDIEEFGRIGFDPADGGIHRSGFTDADMEARRRFMDKAVGAGMATRMDSVGNVIGRLGPAEGACVMTGSHLDSVPAGGMFDGALGALAGLECLRVIANSGLPLQSAIEVVGTAEEEGRFGGMLGADAMAGTLDMHWLETARDGDGVALTEAMAAAGFDWRRAGEAARAPGSVRAFLELHVEQGPVLERRGLSIGIVGSISGCFNWRVRLDGEADHAGTTPMEMRRDAGVGAAEFIAAIDDIIAEAGGADSRVTVGKLTLSPNFPHTVPGRAAFTIIGRDTDPAMMDALESAIRTRLEGIAKRRNLDLDIAPLSRIEPAACSPSVTTELHRLADARSYDAIAMSCGAGHDAQTMSALCETGLIFAPSRDGISHSPQEWTDWADIEKGANLLLDALCRYAVSDATTSV